MYNININNGIDDKNDNQNNNNHNDIDKNNSDNEISSDDGDDEVGTYDYDDDDDYSVNVDMINLNIKDSIEAVVYKRNDNEDEDDDDEDDIEDDDDDNNYQSESNIDNHKKQLLNKKQQQQQQNKQIPQKKLPQQHKPSTFGQRMSTPTGSIPSSFAPTSPSTPKTPKSNNNDNEVIQLRQEVNRLKQQLKQSVHSNNVLEFKIQLLLDMLTLSSLDVKYFEELEVHWKSKLRYLEHQYNQQFQQNYPAYHQQDAHPQSHHNQQN